MVATVQSRIEDYRFVGSTARRCEDILSLWSSPQRFSIPCTLREHDVSDVQVRLFHRLDDFESIALSQELSFEGTSSTRSTRATVAAICTHHATRQPTPFSPARAATTTYNKPGREAANSHIPSCSSLSCYTNNDIRPEPTPSIFGRKARLR